MMIIVIPLLEEVEYWIYFEWFVPTLFRTEKRCRHWKAHIFVEVDHHLTVLSFSLSFSVGLER